ncbi:DNA-3-methyladenine glycosylase family protein [Mucilaginibacter paludis]|uniref:DNA-3-methyladenine glycosylase II n=1 Tax=Mucilaginibacter paludis DSM 18603 TaxID=714943 RepID=H1YGX5_9SPHI|nr:DNA-3-methyladenine glycosylase [Mucilaginibacter paludis]EHQ27384.1 HhH-GPD family protein [Mucilaginibacter paludis DSM 18603]
MFSQFNRDNYHQLCDRLAAQDADLYAIIRQYGYPPFWSRPNTFESLVHIILEQQVSLASALATLNKLKEKIQEITPARVMLLTDEELKACYFSRQKTVYIRHLAENILNGNLSLEELELMPDEHIRQKLTSIKGIGNWTVDIYLIFIVHHGDVFPIGDLAAVNALKKVKNIPLATREEVLAIARQWKPNQTIATMLLWHFYLESRKK